MTATTVNPATVTLSGAKILSQGEGTPQASQQHGNGDGLLDLLVNVDTKALQRTGGDTQAARKGQTYDGASIKGTDTVQIVP